MEQGRSVIQLSCNINVQNLVNQLRSSYPSASYLTGVTCIINIKLNAILDVPPINTNEIRHSSKEGDCIRVDFHLRADQILHSNVPSILLSDGCSRSVN